MVGRVRKELSFVVGEFLSQALFLELVDIELLPAVHEYLDAVRNVLHALTLRFVVLVNHCEPFPVLANCIAYSSRLQALLPVLV